MASNLMMADERVLWMAQREALACSRIIACLQKIAVYRLATAQAFSLVGPASSSAAKSVFLRQSLRQTFLPDVPQHSSGGSCCPGRRLERHDLHVVPEAHP